MVSHRNNKIDLPGGRTSSDSQGGWSDSSDEGDEKRRKEAMSEVQGVASASNTVM